jgi:REP element-mobilizing transposase RayT
MNRGCGRCTLFDTGNDFAAFERVIDYALERHKMRILGYCVMPNHWHFVLWPKKDGELTAFLRSLTHTHTQRWHAFRHTAGTGHLYQGRFKSFPIQEDGHLLDVLRYVERNPLRANPFGKLRAGSGRAGRALALVEPVAAGTRDGKGAVGVVGVAGAPAKRLGRAG